MMINSNSQKNPPDAQRLKDHQAGLLSAYDYHLRATDAWGLEVLRSLFLLNSVGLAGVFALTQGADPIPRASLPFLPFAIGITTAVLAMVAGRFMHSDATDGWWRTNNEFARTLDIGHNTAQNGWRRDVLQATSIILAVTSGISCICAGVALYRVF